MSRNPFDDPSPPKPPRAPSPTSQTDFLTTAKANLRKTPSPRPAASSSSNVLAGEAMFGFNLSSSSLSFLTREKAQEYKDIFDEAGPVLPRFASERGFLEYPKVIAELNKTGCPEDTVQFILALCNVSPSPGYTLPEFCLAMYMCEEYAKNPDEPVPDSIDDVIVQEVQLASGYVDPSRKQGQGPEVGASRPWRPKVDTGKPSNRPVSPQPHVAQTPPSPPRPSPPQNRYAPPPGNPFREEPTSRISPQDAQRFGEVFDAMATDQVRGIQMMGGLTARDVFTGFNLSEDVLARIWDAVCKTEPGHLIKPEFVRAMSIAEAITAGHATVNDIEGWQ